MWNPELRSKVRDRLRSLPSLKDIEIQEDDIYVMPYEKVQLIFKASTDKITDSIRLMDEPKPYTRLSQNLDFFLLCESFVAANDLATDFRKIPEFTIQNFKLAIECCGLIGPGGSPITSFKSSTSSINVPSPSFYHRLGKAFNYFKLEVYLIHFFIFPLKEYKQQIKGK